MKLTKLKMDDSVENSLQSALAASDEAMDATVAAPTLSAKPQRIHFGSLEDQERLRLAQSKEGISSAIQTGIQKGNINITEARKQVLQMSEGSQHSIQAHHDMLDEFERKKRARALNVPTEDLKVKLKLRQLQQPICLFGETAHDRRERLRDLLSRLDEPQKKTLTDKAADSSSSDEEAEEEFFTEGTMQLKRCRESLIIFSLPRAKKRLEEQRHEASQSLAGALQRRQETEKKLKIFTNYGSQFGDDRPLSYCSFSPNGQTVATGSLKGTIKLWTVPNFEAARTWRGHATRIGSVNFHPQAQISLSPSAANVVSCAADGSIALWSLDSNDALGQLVGHKLRVARTVFHPSGNYIASASFDTTWRLWDVATRAELLLQEGHAKSVYSVAFHPDGSLAGTCGLDSFGIIWDLRSGRKLMNLEGHVKPVLALEFSPNGYEVVTGAEDNTVRIWDLRNRKCKYTIPAHTSLVSSLKIDPVHGDYIVTGSHDNTIKAFVAPDWKCAKSFAGHENKIMCVDISSDGKYFLSASYDRTFKLWERDPLAIDTTTTTAATATTTATTTPTTEQ